jgi:hypothetical protein
MVVERRSLLTIIGKTHSKLAFKPRGLAPPNNLESAIRIALQPGNYTAVLSGKNNTTGVGLVEVYDIEKSVSSALTNVSTRGFVGTDQNVLIGGFIISGTGPKKLVVRPLGPTLSNFGVPGVPQNPTLELHNAAGALIAFNDNWGDAPNKQQIIDAHLAPLNAAEPAILATLDPGNYTAIVRGANNYRCGGGRRL